ncbi:MAG: ABC transporter permease subunit [Chloroflexi bacterium]|nr:ABC transporter permease subunit [Chloroflexota bacterium]
MKLSIATPNVSNFDFRRISRLILRQLGLQAMLIIVSVTVLFPIIWIIAMATDARGLPRYSELILIPKHVTTRAFEQLLFEPFPTLSGVYLSKLFSNSLFVALGTAMLSVTLGASAAYAFSRYKFIGRQAGMLGFILLLAMPATGTLVPLIAMFSLLKVHVIFSTLAPAIFYGCLVALLAYGAGSAFRNFLKRPSIQSSNLRWGIIGLLVLFVFGFHFIMWTVLFRESGVYKIAIRDPLTATNDIRDEVDKLRVDISNSTDTKVPRRERELEAAKQEASRTNDFVASAQSTLLGGAANLDAISTFLYRLNDVASFQSPSLVRLADPNLTPGTLVTATAEAMTAAVQAKNDAAIAQAEDKLATERQKNAEIVANLAATEKQYDDARSPYIKLRNDVVKRLIPYMLGTTLLAVVLAAAFWYALRLEKIQISLIRRERFSRFVTFASLTIIVLTAYAWFKAYYESPTKNIGLENGGLVYDIRLAFKDPDDILADLRPYEERDQLQESVDMINTDGIATVRLNLLTALGAINKGITDMEAISTNWKDQYAIEVHSQLESARTSVTKSDPFYFANTDDLASLKNGDYRRELLARLNTQHDGLVRVSELASSAIDQDTVLANFNAALAELPADSPDRALLEESVALIESRGLVSLRLSLPTVTAAMDNAIKNTGRININPDNLDRADRIELKDRMAQVIDDRLEVIRSSVTKNDPFFLGRTDRLNLLNNEHFKAEFLDIMKVQAAALQKQNELIGSADTQEAVITNIKAAMDRLPDDAQERDKLEKEAAIRTSNSNDVNETLKVTLFGLMIAYSSGALPFAIWNLKGYFDTIPKELEEAALVDGAGMVATFFRIILPLTLPALAITTLFGFMSGWTEFILATQFLTGGDVGRSTMAMALRGISGGGQTQADPDYTKFAAMSILMAIPVVSLFYIFQRWIVSGLTVGGVKG